MPLGLSINDEDIAEIADLLSVDFDDENRRRALLSRDSCDVQACPGSGKTTLLVAKLAILARKWTWKDQGICVLSHTNAARQEVEHRLAGHPSVNRLLGYPHFVGTIQAFVDRFLALPSLREMGLEVAMVDNDRSAQRAEQLLQKCYSARVFLSRRINGLDIVRGLRVEGPELTLGSSGGPIPCSQESKTYNELVRLKQWLLKDGLLRYDDMYALAERYRSRHSWVVGAIRHRFPWVFIDEMQDTDAFQDRLLSQLFVDGCILQRFGDSNQGIFSGTEVESQTSFPINAHLGLPDSKRFGQQIANFATPLTRAVSPQNLIGSHHSKARKHTIFVFSPTTILQVLPAFADLLASVFTEGLPAGFIAKAVGFRKTPPTDAEKDKVPYSIGHYHPRFDPNIALKSDRPDGLIDFARKARYLRVSSAECCEATNLLFDGVVELLRIVEATDPAGKRFTKTRLVDVLLSAEGEPLQKLRALFAQFIYGSLFISVDKWSYAVNALKALLVPWLPDDLPESGKNFIAWTNASQEETDNDGAALGSQTNIYRHQTQGGPIEIELATIHSVKGQTHTATLVLETYDRIHDLQSVVNILSGGKIGSHPPVKHMKRIFVAMTRPRELLCLAIRKDHLSGSDAEALSDRGWAIHDLTAAERTP
jgi:hypothetical protein